MLWDVEATPRKVVWEGGSADVPLRLQQSGSVARLTTWRGSSIYLDRWVRWDWTKFTVDGALIDGVQQIDTTDNGSAMDKYLWGIAEVPASFPAAALQAQADRGAHLRGQADRPGPDADADRPELDRLEEGERGPGGAWGRPGWPPSTRPPARSSPTPPPAP